MLQKRSLRQVARSAGIDPGQLSKVERGQKGLPVDSMYRLARALDLDDLVGLLEPHLDRPRLGLAGGSQ